MNPLTVRVFDDNQGVVTTGHVSSTAESIFGKIEEALLKHNVLWSNCFGIGLNNTSVNMGCRNSILTRTRIVNPSIYVMGCPCHIMHYCTEAIHIKVKSSTINSIMVMDSKPHFYIMPLECYIFQSEFYNIPPTVL